MRRFMLGTRDDENTARHQGGQPPPFLPLAGDASGLLATFDGHICLTSHISTLWQLKLRLAEFA